jgi:Fe-S-cluster containining protein
MRSRYARPAAAVRALYRRLDRRIASFRRAAGLACPRGCGECCLSPEVEATVLEMLPLALQLRRQGLLAPTLGRLGGGEPPRRCLFYSPAPLGAFGGHCTMYAWRPLLCRLFGFAAVAGSGGRPELAVCGRMRAADPERAQAAAAAVRSGRLEAPLMRDWSLAAYRLDPTLGSSPLPINAALKQALERVGLEDGLRGSQGRRRALRLPGPRRERRSRLAVRRDAPLQ